MTVVAANVAAEWSQGTLRNLLVREPGRLRLLAGKMLAQPRVHPVRGGREERHAPPGDTLGFHGLRPEDGLDHG